MAEATFAQQMVTKLEALLLANAGVRSVNVDGQQVSFDDLTAQYEHWKRKAAAEAGTRPRVAQINLANGLG